MIEPVTAAQMKADYTFWAAPEPAKIMALYAVENGVTISDLRGPCRKQPLVHYRQDLIAKLRAKTDLSLPAIGRLLNRDHTTVLYALRAVKARAAQ